MKKFSASRSFKKYSGHTKMARKVGKIKRGGMKKKHYDTLTKGSSGGCSGCSCVFLGLLIIPTLSAIPIATYIL